MNNNEIIIDAIVANKIMTAEEMDAMLSAGKMPEYHTYKAWQDKGYQVKKGEKAALKTELWNFTDRPTKEDEPISTRESEEIDKVLHEIWVNVHSNRKGDKEERHEEN